jgi:myo-inositol catabolism protein IolH
MRIAFDPTPLHATHAFLDFPRATAELGFEWIQLTPHPDFLPFFAHPRVDRALLAATKKAVADAGIRISSLLPVQRWSSPDEAQREAAVRSWKRIVEIAVELGVDVLNTEFSGRPERAEESEAAFYRSMEALLPVFEREGLRVNIDPHPDDFVEKGLAAIGFLDRDDALIVSNVFAEDEDWERVSKQQLAGIRDAVDAARAPATR